MPRPLTALPVALVLLAGCQTRLNDSRTLDITAGDTVEMPIDGPKYDQMVTVSVASDQPVHVHVYLKKDELAVRESLNIGKPSNLVLAAKKGVTNDALEVKVPAKQEFVVRFDATTGKPTKVHVKTLGK
jgi:hypothetical protein